MAYLAIFYFTLMQVSTFLAGGSQKVDGSPGARNQSDKQLRNKV